MRKFFGFVICLAAVIILAWAIFQACDALLKIITEKKEEDETK